MKKLLAVAAVAVTIAAFAVMASAVTRSEKSDISRNLDIFSAVFKELQTFYVDSIDAGKSLNTAIDAMLDDIDPYTEYIPADKQDRLKQMTTGEYVGIGSMIMKIDSFVVISGPLPGSPAEVGGLRTGDRILRVDSTSAKGLTTEKVSSMLKGNPGTKVRVQVARPYVEDSILTFDITRRKIQEAAVPFYGKVRGNIGYIGLSSFTDKSADAVRDALLTLKRDPDVRSIVLDLRGNGGGLLDAAVKILGYFLPKGTEVLRTRGRDLREERVYRTTTQPIDTKIPMVVLIDGGTASSAEIVSGALQDLDRAVVVGTRSFGKGLVQTTRPLPYDGQLKVTISKYYIPSGRLIQAIDYSRRNPDGSVSRIPDSLTNVYHTAAGREVRDGGGITPDVTVTYPTPSRMTYNVMEKLKVMDYATRYRNREGAKPDPESFVITDSIYDDFRTFVNPQSINYDHVLDKMIEALAQAAKQEGYMTDSVKASLDLLSTQLRHDPVHDFNQSRSQIERYLGPEIVSRYYNSRGEIQNMLRYDQGLDSAVTVLNTPGRYPKILGKKK